MHDRQVQMVVVVPGIRSKIDLRSSAKHFFQREDVGSDGKMGEEKERMRVVLVQVVLRSLPLRWVL